MLLQAVSLIELELAKQADWSINPKGPPASAHPEVPPNPCPQPRQCLRWILPVSVAAQVGVALGSRDGSIFVFLDLPALRTLCCCCHLYIT